MGKVVGTAEHLEWSARAPLSVGGNGGGKVAHGWKDEEGVAYVGERASGREG